MTTITNIIIQLAQQRKVLLFGILLGLALGLLIGWVLWPLEVVNLSPANLRSDFQRDYILWVAREYSSTGTHPGDTAWARDKLGVEFWEQEELAQTLDNLANDLSGRDAVDVRVLSQAILASSSQEGLGTEEVPGGSTPSTDGGGLLRPLGTVCGVALLVLVVVGGAVFLLRRIQQQRFRPPEGEAAGLRERVVGKPTAEVGEWGAEGAPLAQWLTTYTLGDDYYDPSFAIELENGEFMGECGVGISETIGAGKPDKVTAFEIWLFDRLGIRTVTKVLMSDYAFHDDAMQAKLAPKGDPVLAGPGQVITLETKALKVEARVVDMSYGENGLPANSYFDKLTIELVAWTTSGKDIAAEAEEAVPPLS